MNKFGVYIRGRGVLYMGKHINGILRYIKEVPRITKLGGIFGTVSNLFLEKTFSFSKVTS